MSETHEPPTSYITQQDDMYFYVTEYDDSDLELEIVHESIIEKLGYMVIFHAATLDMRISHGAFRLYILYHYWAHQKGRAWPSLQTLSKHLGVSRPTIVAYNKELEDAGYIHRRSRKSDSGERLSSMVVLPSIHGNKELTRLAAKIFVGERKMELVEGRVQPTEHGVQPADFCVQPTCQEELTKEEVPTQEKRAASPPFKEEYSKPYSMEIYYKDKSLVTVVGTVSNGPWSVKCPSCLDSVTINRLNVPTECLCGMHEFILSPKKLDKPKVQRKSESVEAYYAIVRSRGVRHGANEEFEADIAAAVTDLTRWRQVVKEYIHPDFGGNPYGVDKMLVYYNENRLPGSRKQKEKDALPPRFTDVEPIPDEEDAVPTTVPGFEEMKQQMLTMRRGDA